MADFEPRDKEVIEKCLKAGAGVSISARWFGIDDLIQFAKIAKGKGTLWLWDTDTLEDEVLFNIAKAGKTMLSSIFVSHLKRYHDIHANELIGARNVINSKATS